jgi:hypothetical protein
MLSEVSGWAGGDKVMTSKDSMVMLRRRVRSSLYYACFLNCAPLVHDGASIDVTM